jgi:hypothetical protein
MSAGNYGGVERGIILCYHREGTGPANDVSFVISFKALCGMSRTVFPYRGPVFRNYRCIDCSAFRGRPLVPYQIDKRERCAGLSEKNVPFVIAAE